MILSVSGKNGTVKMTQWNWHRQ